MILLIGAVLVYAALGVYLVTQEGLSVGTVAEMGLILIPVFWLRMARGAWWVQRSEHRNPGPAAMPAPPQQTWACVQCGAQARIMSVTTRETYCERHGRELAASPENRQQLHWIAGHGPESR